MALIKKALIIASGVLGLLALFSVELFNLGGIKEVALGLILLVLACLL